MKATKKPVTVECFKYDGDLKDAYGHFYVSAWAVEAFQSGVIYFKDGEMYIRTLEGDHHASVGDYIIKGVNNEIYPCKPDIFEKTYDIVGAISEKAQEKPQNFSWALQWLKDGHKVSRLGWNGRGMFVVLQKGYPDGIPCNKQTAEAWGLKEGELFRCEPYLQIKMVNGSHSMWQPSVSDCLSDDWFIVKD